MIAKAKSSKLEAIGNNKNATTPAMHAAGNTASDAYMADLVGLTCIPSNAANAES